MGVIRLVATRPGVQSLGALEPGLRAVAERASGLAPGRWTLSELQLEAVGAAVARALGAERVEVWVVGPGERPPALQGLAGHRWVVVAAGEPTLELGVREADRYPLRPGEALGWDLGRCPAGHRSDHRWVAMVAERGSSVELPVALRPAAEWVVRHAGFDNLLYVAICAAVALALGSPALLVAAISFVHYGIYLATFGRRDVAFGEFVRDALFFKALSMASLGWIWLGSSPGPASVAAVVAGVALSSWAASVLGFDRTYFGVELGRVPPARVDRAPYGWVPHPMILGALVALLGVELQPEVRAGWPWLVPGHVALYLVHLAQEVSSGRRQDSTAPAPSGHRSDQDGR